MSDDTKNMRRDFESREDLIAYLTEQFPAAAEINEHVSETFIGGRKAAEARLAAIKPAAYAKTRNHLNGDVTRLSPYLRHGVLSLNEVRNAALDKVKRLNDAQKLIQELAWRDYFQRAYAEIGDGIWLDREDYKTGFDADDYMDEMPEDILTATTGECAVDSMVEELIETGYLHNHARMWLAAYVIHWRRVKWQAGAAWFLEHLLDGDPASNNLSWQWGASTFSHKPYFFNRSNFNKFSRGVYDCAEERNSVFAGSYEQLERSLFPNKPPSEPQGQSGGKGKQGKGRNNRGRQQGRGRERGRGNGRSRRR